MRSAGGGAARLKSQSVEGSAACSRIGAIIHSLPKASLRSELVSASCLVGLLSRSVEPAAKTGHSLRAVRDIREPLIRSPHQRGQAARSTLSELTTSPYRS